jgi:hypothetical protein
MSYSYKPRWTLADDGRTIELADGGIFQFPLWIERGTIEQVAQLPLDYMEMGNKFADEKADLEYKLSVEKSKVAILTADLETLKSRIDGLGDEERQTRLLVILQEDLERAINMALRFAGALGIQPSGPGTLYAEIQEFAQKYGMYYRAPDSAHNVVRNLFPGVPEAIDPPEKILELPSGEEE